jgi:hypothetical protein
MFKKTEKNECANYKEYLFEMMSYFCARFQFLLFASIIRYRVSKIQNNKHKAKTTKNF